MTSLMPASVTYPLAMGALAVGFAVLVRHRLAVRGLTISAAWIWSLLALATIAVVESLVRFAPDYSPPAVSEPMRWFALCGLFMPLISLLGAKRPQDRAWHFIVVSLWAMLALPAAEALMLQRGQALEVHGARSWFLLSLIALTAINFGLVRWRLSAVLAASAQVLMLAEYLPSIGQSLVARHAANERIALGCVLLAVALLLVGARIPRGRPAPAWDRLWLAFRDTYGALWAIRVAEQINQVADQQQWPFRLRWAGFRNAHDGSILAESPLVQQPALAQVIENQLRRFVTPAWIESQLGHSLDEFKPSKT